MNTEELKKRFLSFLWRLAGMSLVALVGFVGQNLNLVNLSPAVMGVAALIVGELTKFLNNKFELGAKLGRVFGR